MTSLSFDPLNQQPDGGCAEINFRSSRRCSLTSLLPSVRFRLGGTQAVSPMSIRF
jgi:hypothetical protein